MNQHNPPLTPDEVETGRRSFLVQLRAELARDLDEVAVSRTDLRDLVALLEALKPVVVDREALEQVVAEALVSHFPKRGMVVASGQSCQCGHWTGEEPQALLGAGMGGSDQLNRHRAIVAVAALYPKATERSEVASEDQPATCPAYYPLAITLRPCIKPFDHGKTLHVTSSGWEWGKKEGRS